MTIKDTLFSFFVALRLTKAFLEAKTFWYATFHASMKILKYLKQPQFIFKVFLLINIYLFILTTHLHVS